MYFFLLEPGEWQQRRAALLFHLGRAKKNGECGSKFFNIASKAPRRDHPGLVDENIKSPFTLGGSKKPTHITSLWFRNRQNMPRVALFKNYVHKNFCILVKLYAACFSKHVLAWQIICYYTDPKSIISFELKSQQE